MEESHECLATGSSVVVSFDYRKKEKILIPSFWVESIKMLEGIR